MIRTHYKPRTRHPSIPRLDPAIGVDWLVGGSVSVGGATPTAVSSWGGATQLLAPGSTVSWLTVCLPVSTPSLNARPGVTSVVLDCLDGSLFATNVNVSGVYYIGVGVYVSQERISTPIWDQMSPALSTDAARDAWLYLRSYVYFFPAGNYQTPFSLEMPVSIPRDVVLGMGQALCVSVSSGASSSGNIGITAFCRSRVIAYR